jgi:hypothetical protein
MLDLLQTARDHLIRRLEKLDERMAKLELTGQEDSSYYGYLADAYKTADSELLTIEIELKNLA